MLNQKPSLILLWEFVNADQLSISEMDKEALEQSSNPPQFALENKYCSILYWRYYDNLGNLIEEIDASLVRGGGLMADPIHIVWNGNIVVDWYNPVHNISRGAMHPAQSAKAMEIINEVYKVIKSHVPTPPNIPNAA